MDLQKVTSQSVGDYYDQMSTFYALTWGDNLHVGYWFDKDDETSFLDAQNRMTDMLIDRSLFKPGHRILDVGSGFGRPALRLAQKTGCDVLGINVSRAQIQRANEFAQRDGLDDRVKFQYMDAMDMAFEDASFDGAWAIESLFHVPDRPQVLRETWRVLRTGARMVIADATAKADMTPEQSALLREGFQLVSLISIEQYLELMAAVGFEVVESLNIGPNTTRSFTETVQATLCNRDGLAAAYGEEFLTQIGQAWPMYLDVYAKKVGYWLFVVEKTG